MPQSPLIKHHVRIRYTHVRSVNYKEEIYFIIFSLFCFFLLYIIIFIIIACFISLHVTPG